MVGMSIGWVWIAGISIHLAISLDTNPENIRVNSRLQEIQPSRQIFTARGDMNNICRDSSSTYLDPSARPILKRQKLAPQAETILSHEKKGSFQSLDSENRERSSKVELWMEKKSTTDHKDLYPSSAERFDSNNHKIANICPIPNHRGVEQKEHHTARELNFDLNQEPMDHISPKFYENLISQGKTNTLSVESTKKGIESKSSIRMDSEPKASEIDIKNFHLHDPNKICSAAAIHYTKDLMISLSEKYTPRVKIPNECLSWNSGKEIWTSEILLPFVYFMVICNPSQKLWKYIKHLTVLSLRAYHQSSLEDKTQSDQEKLGRFVLWHTEVMYHITLLQPSIKSLDGVRLTIRGFCTLARLVWVMNDHENFEKCFSQKSCKSILERHISGTFEEDYKSGYPRNELNQNLYSSTLENWKKKSNEILKIGRYVDWSKFLINHPKDESHPLLLIDQDLQNLKTDPKLLVFMKYWEKDLEKMFEFISPLSLTGLALPHFSLHQICKGMNQFIKTKRQTSGLHKPSEFQVTLFSQFLHQKLNDKYFKRFW
ncbi:uncharacterized protein MELLADRAFT_107739 [Melampsora larici-populina 98AG31]|uniref:Secreted protein n=1 Tax=Melampsora larici-populina (strain 98AG31 / pathotype 3-4-7) TaxID=747676 RepID=F4RQS8_MELLP|nr:uncharacterized protein MELLADRAFT_107739 [Melampsora larici-populina 98AG31]EGG05090.1 hypothetical protein MELLADRAFT_107739 [Melampsora larici-populina 98AG31]